MMHFNRYGVLIKRPGLFKFSDKECVCLHVLASRPHLDEGLFAPCVQLNLIGPPYGLSVEEAEALWLLLDMDGKGVLDFKEFQVK